MEIKTKVFERMEKVSEGRLKIAFIIIILCMAALFVLIIDCMERRHAAELNSVKQKTENQIYNFLTR